MQQISIDWGAQRRVFTVGELTEAIRLVFNEEFGGIWVAGEISGCKESAQGHCYFTLKDREAQLRCVCFRGSMWRLKFKPKDGIAVVARGQLDVYGPRGEYQLLVDSLEPQGHGALQLAFEQLKKRLLDEGLFAAERKRSLPRFPRRIGLITSPTGAVIQDMLQILERRFPGLHIRLYPAQVQGEGSVEAVIDGLTYFGRSGWPDVVVVARGGGSLEDLWTFNEEAVARAIAACPVPVISAIGHETDFTIADFVADLRAPTPSAAAELLIAPRAQILEQVDNCTTALSKAMRYRLAQASTRLHERGIERALVLLQRQLGRAAQRVDEAIWGLRERHSFLLDMRRQKLRDLDQRLRETDLRLRLAADRRRLERAETAIEQRIRLALANARHALEPVAGAVMHLSPLRILDRGYAVVENEAGQVLKSAEEAPVDSAIGVRLAKGRLRARVTERFD